MGTERDRRSTKEGKKKGAIPDRRRRPACFKGGKRRKRETSKWAQTQTGGEIQREVVQGKRGRMPDKRGSGT